MRELDELSKNFAIITDVHGNSSALEAVLKDISNKNINHIFCLGDVVGIGHKSNEVLNLLTLRKDVSFVIGNHDIAVIAAFKQEEPPRGHHDLRAHHQWIADRIDPEYIKVMSNWPKQMEYSVYDRRMLFIHYHLDNENWFLPIDKQPTAESLEQIYAETAYHVVCFGHRHIVHHFVSKQRSFFNPGSLGCYHLPKARYGIVTVTDNGSSARTLEVPYNNERFLQQYNELEVPEKEFILKNFHGGQHSAI